MKARAVLLCVVTIALSWTSVRSQVFEEGGIGTTCEPDSVTADGSERGCPPWSTTDHDDFRYYDVDYYNSWIDLDVDLLISWDFDGQEFGVVSDTEANNLLYALDEEFENRYDWSDTDLGMTFKYAHRSGVPYSHSNPMYHFLIFQDCLSNPDMTAEINHVDIYLTPDGPACYGADGEDTEEDGPAGDPNVWRANAVSVNDAEGNAIGDDDETHWPKQSAQQVCHEFTHACWSSNMLTYGWHYAEASSGRYPDYNELFACGSEILLIPEPWWWSHRWDLRYAYSVLNDMGTCVDPPSSETTVDRNSNRYHLWKLFAAYLGWRFQDPDVGNTLLSRWSQNLTDRDNVLAMERTFCGLAVLLDDDELYGYLGYGPEWDGAWRVSNVFADYGIARWVDDDGYDPAFYFGPDYSPCWSQGQFRKVDSGSLAYWELAIPPEFVLGADNVDQWTGYPDPADQDCPDGWFDHEHGDDPSIGHFCVPIQVDLWGSNYLTFRADTDYFTQGWDDTLVVEFDWTTGMNPHVQLWLSVLTYRESADSLFLHGDKLREVLTSEHTPYDPQTATIRVPGFKRDDNEAVVVVLTVTDRSYTIDHDSGYKCLRRKDYDGEDLVDLSYTYRFKVVGTYDPGGGCPFVASRTSSGYIEDNNVLASGVVSGSDILDAYLLAEKPEAIEGEYGIRISENDTDYTRFDRIRLLAVDHSPDLDVAAFSDGSVGPYSVSALPVACHDSEGRDLLNAVLAQDGESALIEEGSWIEVVFPASEQPRGGGVGTRGNPSHKIDPPGGGGRDASPPGVLDLTELCYRANPCTRILDAQGDLVVEGDLARLRVTAPRDFYLDYIFLADRPPEPVLVWNCDVARAQHSAFGDCSGAVAMDDGSYVGLAPGDAIEVIFRAPQQASNYVRDFVLVTEGQYEFGRSDEETPEPQPEEPSPRAVAYPNPFRELTTISYDVPQPGGNVIVRVYSAAGRLVRELVNQPLRAGGRTVIWDGTDDHGGSVASGVYFCKIQAAGREAESRLVVLK